MLRASRRVLRPGGRTAFHAIFVAPGLRRRDRRRASRYGPPEIATASDYPRLLRSAGFVEIEEADGTAAYLATARAWLRHEQEAGGPFAEGLTRRREAVAVIEAGLLRRSLFVGVRSAGGPRAGRGSAGPARPTARSR